MHDEPLRLSFISVDHRGAGAMEEQSESLATFASRRRTAPDLRMFGRGNAS